MKFSNNEFAKFGDHYDLIEFSHWTYERTHKKMMVVDLQGLETEIKKFYQLTDPAIHSVDKMFGPTDLGPTGFSRFMLTHLDDCPRKKKSKAEVDVNQEVDEIKKYLCENCKIYLTNENEFRMGKLVCKSKNANLYKTVENVEHGIANYQVYIDNLMKIYF